MINYFINFSKKSVATFIYDAILLLGDTIIHNCLVGKIPLKSNISCHTETPWSFGYQFIGHLKANSFHGLSGRIQFDGKKGLRNNLTFLIVDKIKDSIDLV